MTQDPQGTRNLLHLGASALAVVEFSNLAAGDFGACSDELFSYLVRNLDESTGEWPWDVSSPPNLCSTSRRWSQRMLSA